MPTAAEPIEERTQTMSKFIVYALIDPRDGAVRYIGKSSSGLKRPHRHDALARRQDRRSELRYCYRWIRKLQALGLNYRIEVIEQSDCGSQLGVREQWWIALARAWGCRLTNLTDGGEGFVGLVFTEEHRARLSAAQRGRHHSEATRARLRELNFGRHDTKETCEKKQASQVRPEVVAKKSAAMRAVFASAEVRLQMGAKQRTAMARPETKARLCASVRTLWARESYRENRRAAFARPEYKERIRISVCASWVRRRAKEVLATQQGPM